MQEERNQVELNVGHKLDKFDPETMEDESVEVHPQNLGNKDGLKEQSHIRPPKISNYQHNKINQDEVVTYFSVSFHESACSIRGCMSR